MNENVKSAAKDLIDKLPEEAEWDDLMYEIYVRQSIEKGMKDSHAGRTISHEEIKRKYKLV